MKRTILLITVAFLCQVMAWAATFKMDGVYYNIISVNELEVVEYDSRSPYKEVKIPNEFVIQDWTYKVTRIGDKAFKGCFRLTSITFPDGLKSIGDKAFESCDGLTSITLPDGLKSIGEGAFTFCYGLTSITLPDGLESIGPYAFNYCPSLSSITLPKGLKSIGSAAFRSSPLKSVIALGVFPAECETDAWEKISTRCVLHVPAGSEVLYRYAKEWDQFSTIIGDASSSIADNTIPTYQLSVIDGGISVTGITAPLPFSIYHLNGELISKELVDDGEIVSTDCLPAGVYIVKVGEWSEKVVIQR